MVDASLPLEAWTNYYVIVGSSAGGLTGLTFVVIAFVAEAHAVRATGLRAFVTPTIVHFGSALALSALMNVPGLSARELGLCIGAFGLIGTLYSAGTVRHVRRTSASTQYQLVAEDWIWNVILPTLTYVALLVAGLMLESHATDALRLTAAGSLALLLIGIHNAWDIAVWFTAERPSAQEGKPPPPTAPPSD